jgi:PAS domain S-box-containing protein
VDANALAEIGCVLFADADEALFVLDPDSGRLLHANHAAALLCAGSAADVCQRAVHELFASAVPGGWPAPGAALDPAKPADAFLLIPGTGLRVAVTLTLRPLKSGPGPRVLLQVRHRSGPENAAGDGEAGPGRCEQRLALALEAAGLGIWEYDPAAGTVHWSRNFRRLFGLPAACPPDPALFHARLLPGEPQRLQEAALRALEPGGSGECRLDFRGRGGDGGERFFTIRGHTFFEGDGPARRPRLFLGIVQDVTEQRRAQETLAERERFIQSVVRAAPEIVYVYNLIEHRSTYVNGQALPMLGYTPEQLNDFGSNLLQVLLHPADVPRALRSLRRFDHVRDGEVLPWAYRLRDAQGKWHWFHGYDTVFERTADGRPQSVIGVAQDATGQRRAAAALRRSSRQLRTLSRRLLEVQEQERRHLARELHDEIGGLLTGLSLTLSDDHAGCRDRQDRAHGQVQELAGRVRDLSLRLRPSMLDDLGLVPALLWLCERYTVQTGVGVQLSHRGLIERLPPETETAAYRIVQEALTNVARHAHAARAEVRVWHDGGEVHLEVSDRGAGFDPATVRAAGETGGLSGMRERAALLGGRWSIQSRPGEGTCVRARLPARPGRTLRDGGRRFPSDWQPEPRPDAEPFRFTSEGLQFGKAREEER